MNTSSIPEVQLVETEGLTPRKLEPRMEHGFNTDSVIVSWPLAFLGWCWRVVVGSLFCFSLIGSIIVTGWTYRWLQGLVLRGWWKRSRFGQQGSFEEFCASLGHNAPVSRPRWFMEEWIKIALNRPDAAGRQPGTIRKILRALRLPWHSLWLNFKIGLQGLFCTYVLTGLGCLLMLFSWEFGWLNSFNKGYEQAVIGPLTGFLGVFIFIAAMFYVPMAQVHQAVTGDYRAFFDVRFVWQLIRARLSAYVILAALITLTSVLMEILKIAPGFFGDLTESWSDAEVLKMLQNYYLVCCLVLFVSLLTWRWLAARIYQSAVLKVLERGWFHRADLHPTLMNWLDRLGIFPVPTLESAGIGYVVKSGGRIVYRRMLFVVLFFIWFGFVAKVYVGEFLNYHPISGFMNHPLIQFPHFNYTPPNLKS